MITALRIRKINLFWNYAALDNKYIGVCFIGFYEKFDHPDTVESDHPETVLFEIGLVAGFCLFGLVRITVLITIVVVVVVILCVEHTSLNVIEHDTQQLSPVEHFKGAVQVGVSCLIASNI